MLTLDPARTAVVAIDMHRGHLDPAVATLPLPAERHAQLVVEVAVVGPELDGAAEVPLGVNVESVSINRDEIDASVDLLHALRETMAGK